MPKDALLGNGDFLPRKRLLSDAEIDRLVRAFVELGVTKIRITGGEPLLRPGLASLIELKINTVVQRGVNDHTVMDMVRHFRGSGHILRLIEFMDVGSRNHWSPDRVVPGSKWLQLIHDRWPLRPIFSRQSVRRRCVLYLPFQWSGNRPAAATGQCERS